MNTVKTFIQTLSGQETKMTMIEFFKEIHSRFYSHVDISFMDYFLELAEHENEFVVHHSKLIEYGIVTSTRSNDIKDRLNVLSLTENEDYTMRDVPQQWEKSRGLKHCKVYYLTPEAFKKCLMRAQRRPNQRVDPVIYCNYYLLLEKIYKLYTEYEKTILEHVNKNLQENIEQKDKQISNIEQEKQNIEQDLKDTKEHALILQEMMVKDEPIQRTQVLYIATTHQYAKTNHFKTGGVEAIDKLKPRLSTYNTGRIDEDLFYYSDIFTVANYHVIESQLKNLLGRFRNKKEKEMYRLHYNDLAYIVRYLCDREGEDVNEINSKLAHFIANLNKRTLRPVVPAPDKRYFTSVTHLKEDGTIDNVVIKADCFEDTVRNYVLALNPELASISKRKIFDDLNVTKDRTSKFFILETLFRQLRPDIKLLQKTIK